jgi:hypothetical protein
MNKKQVDMFEFGLICYLPEKVATIAQIEGYLRELECPEWDNKQKCHDWKNHVPEVIENSWDSLPIVTKQIVYLMASEQAHNEEWD